MTEPKKQVPTDGNEAWVTNGEYDTNFQSRMTRKGRQNLKREGAKRPTGKTLNYRVTTEGVDEVTKQMDDLGTSTEATGEKMEHLVQGSDNVAESSDNAAKSTANWSSVATTAGGAAVGLGTALGLLGNYLTSLGFEKAGKALSEISGWLTGIGMVLMIAPGIIKGVGDAAAAAGVKAGVAWAWLAGIALILAAIVVAVYLFTKALEEASEEA